MDGCEVLVLEDRHQEIIDKARQGDTQAFTELVHMYKDFVYRTAYSVLRDRLEAEDVAQETFVKALSSLHSLKDNRAFAKWIATIATRIALNVIRKKSRMSVSDDVVNSVVETRVSSPSMDRLVLQESLLELSSEHRTVLMLREVHGFDYQEIASILDIPIGTVRSRLHTARMQMRNLLRRDEG